MFFSQIVRFFENSKNRKLQTLGASTFGDHTVKWISILALKWTNFTFFRVSQKGCTKTQKTAFWRELSEIIPPNSHEKLKPSILELFNFWNFRKITRFGWKTQKWVEFLVLFWPLRISLVIQKLLYTFWKSVQLKS